MRILAVDDEVLALEAILDLLKTVAPESEVKGFRRASEALSCIEEWKPDVALLDINMRSITGVELAKKIQEKVPRVNIIFTTGYDEYTKEALDMHASGYLLKPVTEEKLKEELSVLRFTPEKEDKPKLYFRTFGNFEVFYKGEPVRFQYQKTKELVAYLIDQKGTLCSVHQIIAALWEDCDTGAKMSYLNRIRADLLQVLKECGEEDILIRQRGEIGILQDKIHCDYYTWLRGKERDAYKGEYMSQYSWAEETNGWLTSMTQR